MPAKVRTSLARRVKERTTLSRVDRSSAFFAVAVVAVLATVSLALVFRHGAYAPVDWLLLMVAVALLAAVVFAWGPSVGLSSMQRILLGLLGLQAVWTAASMLWAGSVSNAWQETNRTLFYLLAIGLVVAAVRWNGPRTLTWLAGGLVAVAGVVAVAILLRLGLAADPLRLFANGRLNYPVSYWNGLAALLMIGFWLALGLGTTGIRYRWTQPLLLACAVLFLELAVLPQSRGALWTFAFVVPFFVILSPHRFRALANLAMVLAPLVIFLGPLNAVWVATRDNVHVPQALATVLRDIGFSVLIVLVLWAMSWLVERRIAPLSRRVVLWIGIGLVVFACLGLISGLVVLDREGGGLGASIDKAWTHLTSDQGPSNTSQTRFTAVGFNGRLAQWRVAADAFVAHPLEGLGAQNFEFYWYQNRTIHLQVPLPHSLPMQLLSGLGVVGAVAWLAFVLWALIRGGVLRFQASRRTNQVAMAAIITAVLSWFIHSSVETLWQLAGVSLPAMMLLGGLVGSGSWRVVPTKVEEASKRPSRVSGVIGIRAAGVAVAVAILVSAALPYLSLRYADLAVANGSVNPATAISSIRTAAWLDRFSPAPVAAEARIFASAAEAPGTEHAILLDDLALAASAWEQAGKREPLSWDIAYRTSLAVLAYRDAAEGAPTSTAGSSALWAADPALWAEASSIRSSGWTELTRLARSYLEQAVQLNPLSPEVKEALKKLDAQTGS